jgi:crotonobetainyl-CoA:carnitine CoA-transferase CaiB-like acyl-CoA transferase
MSDPWLDAHQQLEHLNASLGLELDLDAATLSGPEPILPSRYPLASSAAAVIAAVGLAAARVWTLRGGPAQRVALGTRHAGALMRGFYDMQLDGEVLAPDPTGQLPLAGIYPAADGRWLQLYGVIEPLDRLTLAVLEAANDPEALARAVARRPALEWEQALAAAGAPGAMVRTRAQWQRHPQGQLLATQPVLSVEQVADAPAPAAWPRGPRPLSGLRVLDLTRVVAGPVCGRTLAEHGAEVLALAGRDLPWIRRAMIDTSAGKRSASVDIKTPAGLEAVRTLVRDADVFCQGARPGRLRSCGLGLEDLVSHRPGLIYVSVDGWGETGPWRDRAGFEALAHAATGVTAEHAETHPPRPLAALPGDHLTGYLAALGVLTALARRQRSGGSWHVHVSLARTVSWLQEHGSGLNPSDAIDLSVDATADLRVDLPGAFGTAFQLQPAPVMSDTPARWTGGASLPGTDPARFAP